MLGDFQNYESMRLASERFVAALTGKRPVVPQQQSEPRRDCGHDSRFWFTYAGKHRCRKCSPRTAAEQSRERRLPEMIENTQTKLDHLLTEAKRRGIVL